MANRNPDFLDAFTVAFLLGLSVKQFRARRAWLEEVMDFPLPLPTSLRPRLWRADQVRAWTARQGLPGTAPPPPPPTPGGNVVMLAEARRA